MFKSSDICYRLAHHGVARRLGVEAMENRLMLSATALDFMQEYLSPTRLTPNISQSSLSPAPPILTATLAEGGFFTLNSSRPGQYIFLPNDQVSSAVLEHLINHSISGGGNPFGFDSMADGSNYGIRPVVIGPSNFKPTTEPTSVSGIQPTNGGVIVIESILNNVEKSSGVQTVEQGKTTSPIGLAGESRQKMNFAATFSFEEISISDEDIAIPSDDSAISGEWARAMMFEITGGEPMKTDRPTPSERDKWRPKPADAAISKEGEPLSFKGNSSPTVAYRTDGRQSDGGENDCESGAPLSIESFELTEVAIAGLNSFALVNDRSNAVSLVITPSALECDFNAEELGISDFHASSDSVLAEAFEQLSDDAPLFADDYWQRAFEATLVLLVLSLEQATIRNSKQGDKSPSALSTWPPRRSL